MPLHFSLRELEVFCAIARCNGVKRAAESIGLTQSAASQALARLERGLGAQLFDRRGRRLVLSEQGRSLLPRARALLDGAQALEQAVHDQPPALDLAASTTVVRYVLPRLLAQFRARHDRAEVRVHAGNTAEVIAAVHAMTVDFGLIEGPCHQPGLVVTPWREDALVLIAPPGHALTHGPADRAQLARARWLLRERGSGTREEVESWLRACVGPVQPDMELGDSETIWRAVAAGLGISCLPFVVVADPLRSGAVAEIHTRRTPPTRMFSVVRHPGRPPTRGLQVLMELAGGLPHAPTRQ